MKTFWKGIASVLLYVIGGALLVYAASRSLDFISSTLPGNQQVVGFLGLAATSGGMLTWLMLFMFHSQGLGQKITAGLMTVLDMAGEFALFTMDTLFRSGQTGMISGLSQNEIQMVILGLSALIATNIFATVAYHLLDSENIRDMREAMVRDQLEARALKEIEKKGEELARTLAPALASQWMQEFESKFSDFRALGFGASIKTKAETNPAPAVVDSLAKNLNDLRDKIIQHPTLSAPPDAVVKGNGHSPSDPT